MLMKIIILLFGTDVRSGFIGKDRLEIAASDATIVCNDGEMGRLKMYLREVGVG